MTVPKGNYLRTVGPKTCILGDLWESSCSGAPGGKSTEEHGVGMSPTLEELDIKNTISLQQRKTIIADGA